MPPTMSKPLVMTAGADHVGVVLDYRPGCLATMFWISALALDLVAICLCQLAWGPSHRTDQLSRPRPSLSNVSVQESVSGIR